MTIALTPTHPVLACAATVRQAVKDAAGSDPVFMSCEQKQRALLELDAAVDQLRSLRLSVLAAADVAGDVADAANARNVASWAAKAARRDGAAARREVRLGRALEGEPTLKAAVAQGLVNLDQAETILHALRELDRNCPDLDAGVRIQAVDHLIAAAEAFGPRELRALGRRILVVINPDVADEYERRRLEDEEAHARRRCYFSARRNGDGTTDLKGRLSDATAALLLRILHSFTNRRREEHETSAPDSPFDAPTGGATAPDDRRPYDQRMGHALTAFLESVDPGRLPMHGGDVTRVVVTIDLAVLREQLAGIGLIGDEPISASEVRRLACNAGLIPAVLGGDSEVLDLGRSQRLYGPAARRAHAVRFTTCQAHGCDVPAEWCEAHHRTPWSMGGATDLDQLVFLCSFHHHRAHDPRVDTGYAADGTVSFHRRT